MKEVLMEVEADWRVCEEMAARLESDLIIEYTEQCSEETDTHLPIYDPDDGYIDDFYNGKGVIQIEIDNMEMTVKT